jgi:hypothetical protein
MSEIGYVNLQDFKKPARFRRTRDMLTGAGIAVVLMAIPLYLQWSKT